MFVTLFNLTFNSDDHVWKIKPTKTERSTRQVELNQALADRIREQGYIYKGYPGGISKYFDRTLKKLGIPHFTLHKLRHYFASCASTIGIPEADILEMGVWSTDFVMKGIYRHAQSVGKSWVKLSSEYENLVANNEKNENPENTKKP